MPDDPNTRAIVPVEGTKRTILPDSNIAGVLQEDGNFREVPTETHYNSDGEPVEIRPAGDGRTESYNNLFR